jgi:hypothetical protein
MNSPTEHTARADCAVPPASALAFLADGLRLGRWGLGSMDTVEVAPGVVRGTSLFDGSHSHIRPVLDAAAGAVDYHVGSDPARLTPRIQARVAPAPGGCVVSLHARRTPDMDDARWLRLVRCHEVEVLLIQAQLEHLFPHPASAPTPD